MGFLFIAGILLFIGLYALFAAFWHVPTFRTSSRINRTIRAGQPKHTLMGLVAAIANPLASHLPLDRVKRIKATKLLQAANVNLTPEQFLARKLVLGLFFALPLALLGLVHPFCLLIPLLAFALTFFIYNSEITDQAQKRAESIERELPQFVAHVASATQTNSNIIQVFEAYKQNYDTPLTRELSLTIADMRTGVPELALQHMEIRLNHPLMTELIRCLLSSLQGENMALRYDALVEKTKARRRNQLRLVLQKTNAKISGAGMTLAMWAAASLMIIILISVFVSGVGTGGL